MKTSELAVSLARPRSFLTPVPPPPIEARDLYAKKKTQQPGDVVSANDEKTDSVCRSRGIVMWWEVSLCTSSGKLRHRPRSLANRQPHGARDNAERTTAALLRRVSGLALARNFSFISAPAACSLSHGEKTLRRRAQYHRSTRILAL